MKRRYLAILAGGFAALATACYDLEVTAIQPAGGTAFTREEVLRKPELIELVVAGLFINFWGGATYAQPWFHLAAFGEEVTSSANSTGNFNRTATQPIIIWDVIKEHQGTPVSPQPPQHVAFDNSLSGSSLFARDPWSNFYEANAAATEMTRLVARNNLVIRDPASGLDNTHRVLTFAKWLQGMTHIHLGMLFDSASVIDTTVDLSGVPVLPFRHYTEVRDSGVKWLNETIEMTRQQSFVFPLNDDLWIYNTAVSNDELAAISNSYIARAKAYSARTPAERIAVNWDSVKMHIQRGVTGPFGPLGIPNPIISMDFRQMMAAAPSNIPTICNLNNNSNSTNYCGGKAGVVRVDLRLLGPADTLGGYQTWLQKVSVAGFDTVTPFVISTPDKRIQPAPGNTAPLNKPTFFKFTDVVPPASIMPSDRGAYYYSNYWSSSRGLNNHLQFPNAGGGRVRRTGDLNIIQDAMLLPAEMDLLLAEAEIRLNNPGAAVPLINKTRVANGELPAVTITGVPVSNACVPKRWDGSCGTLFDALMYEKRLETYGTGIAYFDLRGWGCLLEGTLIHLPPPGRQLDLLDKDLYTFGGAGSPGGAPRPTDCPLLHRPVP